MRKILVLRGGALGDFLVTLPALALLRARWPSARIELAGNATAARLALARGLLDPAHSQHEARWSALHDAAPLPPDFARWLADFDLVLNFWPDPDGRLRAHFPLRPEQLFLEAPALPLVAPAAAHYCAPLRALGLEPRELLFSLAQRTPAADSGPIAVHPGSGSPRKNWPADRWRALLTRLPGPVSLILGEAELARSSPEHWLAAAPPGSLLLVNRPLEELVSHLAACRLFVGHDSGISHLAAACGTPAVLLFGPTDPAMWAPPSPRVRILHAPPDLSGLSVDAVERAVLAALADRA